MYKARYKEVDIVKRPLHALYVLSSNYLIVAYTTCATCTTDMCDRHDRRDLRDLHECVSKHMQRHGGRQSA